MPPSSSDASSSSGVRAGWSEPGSSSLGTGPSSLPPPVPFSWPVALPLPPGAGLEAAELGSVPAAISAAFE